MKRHQRVDNDKLGRVECKEDLGVKASFGVDTATHLVASAVVAVVTKHVLEC